MAGEYEGASELIFGAGVVLMNLVFCLLVFNILSLRKVPPLGAANAPAHDVSLLAAIRAALHPRDWEHLVKTYTVAVAVAVAVTISMSFAEVRPQFLLCMVVGEVVHVMSLGPTPFLPPLLLC
jgi:hypothetical protein